MSKVKRQREERGAAKVTAGAEILPVLASPPDEARRITFSTVGDLGNHLPAGVLQGGTLHRGFAFKPYRTREERYLESFREKNKGLTMADFITAALAYLLTGLGPYADFQSMTDAERRMIVSQLWVPDVVFILLQLRIGSMGEELAFDLKCPACAHRWRYGVDLRRTDVVVAEDISALTWPFELRDGLTTTRGQVARLTLQPPRWFSVTGKRGDVKGRIAAAAIRRVGDFEDLIPTPDMLDDLSKRDLERIQKEIDDSTPGADLELDVQCPHCDHEFQHAIVPMNWDFFFGASSL